MGSIKSILFLIYVINAFKIFISLKVLSISQFQDYDLVNFYKPAADSFSKVYISNDPNFFKLSALVTPLFPLFLKIFGHNLLAHSVYIILSILILVLVYKIVLKLTSKKTATISVLLLSLEPSFFISSINMGPELLFSFTLTLALYFGVCKPITKIELNYFLLGILIGLSVLIRPIALVMIICLITFWIINYYHTSQTIFLSISVIASIFALVWSIRNLVVHGFLNVSSISSNNIFWFEGVAALSETKDISFEEAKIIEGELRNRIIGNNPSVIEEYNYASNRGLELVFKNPIGWIQSHFKGTGKVLFGVYKSKFQIINEKIFGIDNQIIQSVHFIILGVITLLVWIFFVNGIKLYYKLDVLNARLTFLMVLAMLLPATGQIAYARFRAPAVPFLCIIAAIGAQSILSRDHRVIKWKR